MILTTHGEEKQSSCQSQAFVQSKLLLPQVQATMIDIGNLELTDRSDRRFLVGAARYANRQTDRHTNKQTNKQTNKLLTPLSVVRAPALTIWHYYGRTALHREIQRQPVTMIPEIISAERAEPFRMQTECRVFVKAHCDSPAEPAVRRGRGSSSTGEEIPDRRRIDRNRQTQTPPTARQSRY